MCHAYCRAADDSLLESRLELALAAFGAQAGAVGDLALVLGEGCSVGLPLHVLGHVESTTAERDDVIDDVARAGASGLACCWAGVVGAEVANLVSVSALCLEGECSDEGEDDGADDHAVPFALSKRVIQPHTSERPSRYSSAS